MRLLSALLLAALALQACRSSTPFRQRTASYSDGSCEVIWTPVVVKDDRYSFEGIQAMPRGSFEIEWVRVTFEEPTGSFKEEANGRPVPSEASVVIGPMKVPKSPTMTGVALVKIRGITEPKQFVLR